MHTQLNNNENNPSTLYLSSFGLLKVSGHDAKKFLQGQLTCHIEEVTLTESRRGAHCNPQGRIISFFHLFLFHDHYYLLLPRQMVSIALDALKKYAVFYKISLIDASEEWQIIGCVGEIPNHLLANQVCKVIDSKNSLRYFIIGARDTLQSFTKNFTHQMTFSTWKSLQFKDHIPAIYPETSGLFLPHEINLPQLHAISFDKGCYTGQEIIARMHYRGKLKTQIYQASIKINYPPLPGSPIYYLENNYPQIGGTIVDVCEEDHNYRLLIITDKTHAKNKHLFLDIQHSQYLTLLD